MRVVCDIEANGLENPTEIWLICCKDIDTGVIKIFREVTQNKDTREEFLSYATSVTRWIGHNFLGYDYPVLNKLISLHISDIANKCVDTFVISELIDYSRSSHSVEDYGLEFGLPKISFSDFTKWSQEMEDYCVRDVDITHKIYLKYLSYIDDPVWREPIHLEQSFQYEIVNDLHSNGFAYNKAEAERIRSTVIKDLSEIDIELERAFPPREVLIREFTPKGTKHGTISKSSVPRVLHNDIHNYEIGQTYRHTRLEPFNPASHKQIIQVLIEAGWSPWEKTKTLIDTEREIRRLEYTNPFDTKLKDLYVKLDKIKLSAFKVNENNLGTLPPDAPAPARLLAKRILLEARRRTLTEQIDLVQPDGRIHGKFLGIGAWTQRMAHQNPNMANIPREFKEDGSVKFLGKELRSLWIAPSNRLLVGVDAEGIQLRILAHYLDDPEFTKALVEGKKHDKSDPHSLNQRILGGVCKSRQAAKRFIYALLLGAGISKLAQVLETSQDETKAALHRLMSRYQGWKKLKEFVLPADGARGWFRGIDGRNVAIPGETSSSRTHLAMSGYLQNGEAIIMKRAALTAMRKINGTDALRCVQPSNIADRCYGTQTWDYEPSLNNYEYNSSIFNCNSLCETKIVNLVHDEIQLECPDDMSVALEVAKIVADAIKEAGEFYKLKCPMAGSYFNDDTKQFTIGKTWYATH